MGKVTRLLPSGVADRPLLLDIAPCSAPAAEHGRKESGAYGIRTRDLLNAIEALYQLS
jgi:hypothetical protein